MTSVNNEKLEKKAKVLLACKDIPKDKMDVVHSLINNNSLSKEEKYSAVIDIIRLCPDRLPHKKETKKFEFSTSAIKNYFAPVESSIFVNQLFNKYKSAKLFKKRYLIHVNNSLGIGIQKRLIPGKRLMKVLREIISFQEKILIRLPDILMGILKDETIDDASHFNYLRIFRRWMLETPLIKYDKFEMKWMTPAHIEAELESYITNYFSFQKLDIETREQILLLAENKLRNLDDLKKEEINPEDSLSRKNEKEKKNLEIEKTVYEYMMILRAFIQSYFPASNKGDVLSEHLKVNYGINSFPDFLIMLLEALVYQREIELTDIIRHYNILPYSVSSENWDYSNEFLKEVGKDAGSRKRKQLQILKNQLVIYDELYSFLKLQKDGQIILENAVETQWKIADKRQKEYAFIYNEDFLTFIDECVNYFNNSYVPLLNGSSVIFKDKNESTLEGKIFASNVFAGEINGLTSLINELYYFKSSNPRLAVSREEAKKIMQGKTRSMFEVERFIMITGDIFIQIAGKIHILYDKHRSWISGSKKPEEQKSIYMPVKKIPDDKDEPAPIPFYNCTIMDFKDKRQLTDRQTGNVILTDSARSGIVINLCAFAYQLAYECFNEQIFSKLASRKEIQKKIADAEL
jgi:hypothetical protein